jgi:L-alanine-DL-glutamate epimerase-like enolase superfamily enzyme
MRRPFLHAAHARSASASVLMSIQLGDEIGWGEGAPRRYVSGESMEGAVEALSRVDLAELAAAVDWASFETSVASLARIDLPRLVGGGTPAPAAAAALEIALLDALGRLHRRPLCDVPRAAGLDDRLWRARPEPVSVALVIDLAREPAEVLRAVRRDSLEPPRHVKVKAAADPDETARRLDDARAWIPAGAALSLDVNGAWPPDVALAAAPRLAERELAWVEEPTHPRSWDAMRRLSEEAGLNVMLDESFVDAADLELAAEAGAASHVNVRVSKCGGVLRAALLAERARALGLRYQVGVQVGEAGPLWAAGRMLATTLRDPETVEAGRQDEWFPEPLTLPPYAVDRSRHRAAPLKGPGTGVRPSPELLGLADFRASWRHGDWRAAA